VPDYDLNIMQPGQGLTEITCRILEGLKPILADFKPDVVLVHGKKLLDDAITQAQHQPKHVLLVDRGLAKMAWVDGRDLDFATLR
ncbi:hypothetical protein MJM59_31070, partial [Salmonella enterica subsp. enterica serovar Montevideo]|nr:hypothetical protein [Salmonella enterica subsp. enterica serovar Montevideo]